MVVLVAWLVLVASVPTFLRYRQAGTVARLVRAETGSPAWWAKLISSVGILLAFGAPIAALMGLAPIPLLDRDVVHYVGLALAITGITGTVGAQVAHGRVVAR